MGIPESLRSLIEQAVTDHPGPSRPGGWYSADGDCFFFHAEDVPYYRVRLTGLITVYEAQDDGRAVGIQIKGVRKLIREEKDLSVEIAKYAESGDDINLIYLLGFALRRAEERKERISDPALAVKAMASAMPWKFPADELVPAVE